MYYLLAKKNSLTVVLWDKLSVPLFFSYVMLVKPGGKVVQEVYRDLPYSYYKKPLQSKTLVAEMFKVNRGNSV